MSELSLTLGLRNKCSLIKNLTNALHSVSNGVITVPKRSFSDPFYMVSVPILLCITLALGTAGKALENNDFLDVSYPYVASERELSEVMAEFAQRTSLPVNVSSALQGTVDVRNSSGTIGSFLNQISSKTQSVWWHDGIVLHLEPATSIASAYVDVSDISNSVLTGQIGEMGLLWDAFPIRFSGDGSMARIAGPESYVKQVSEVVERLVEMKRNRPERVRRSLQPRLYFGGRAAVVQSREPVQADDLN